jgi:cytochrome c peroxidase
MQILAIGIAISLAGCALELPDSGQAFVEQALNPTDSNDHQYNDATGTLSTHSTAGVITQTGAFFQALGSNGRACFTCHQIDQGWSIAPAGVQARFDASSGTDPIFRTVDGSNSPTADVSTLAARRTAYSMLLTKGLIRIGLPIPATAEFSLQAVSDPYGFASASQLSLFRRPLPSTNLKFLSTVMWDGRENASGSTLDAILLHQASAATLSHAEGAAAITAAQARDIVDFEIGLTTTQHKDVNAMDLAASSSNGGAVTPAAYLSTLTSYVGINDLFGDSQTGAPFDPGVFKLYDVWTMTLTGTGDKETARRSILRGEVLFNTRAFTISGVNGINDNPAFGSPAQLTVTCTSCHDTPSAGNHSVALALNLGLSDASRRTPDMPLYTLRNTATGATIQTTDPGRALVTGKWADIGKFKGPILRALSARAPYFHNGFAADLDAVIAFYVARFGVALTADERADLLRFLQSL